MQLSPPFGPYQGQIVYEMQLRSNDSGDILSFQYYDASEDQVLDIEETYEFIINDILGDVINPVIYNIDTGGGGNENNPNLEDNPGAYEFTATIAGAIILSDGNKLESRSNFLLLAPNSITKSTPSIFTSLLVFAST